VLLRTGKCVNNRISTENYMEQRTDITILWLTDNYYPSKGGMAQSCDRIVYHLRKKGVTLDLVHFAKTGKDRIERKVSGYTCVCSVDEDVAHSCNRIWSKWSSEWEKKKYSHVVIFGGFVAMSCGPVYARWLGAPLVTCIRGNDFDTAVYAPKRREHLLATLEYSDAVCSVTREKKNKIEKLCTSPRVFWTPNGIDWEKWKADTFDKKRAEELRLQYAIGSRVCIGLFGFLKKKKGVLFFLEQLVRSGVSERVHLLFAGEVEEVALEWLDAHKSINYSYETGRERFDLIPCYLCCDWAAVPSLYDGMPNVMLEAMGLGIPLIASSVGGMNDVVTHGEQGLLFNFNNAGECARVIAEAVTIDASLRRKMGENALNMVRKQFTVEKETDNYYRVFTELMKKD
jgi:glycogen synthase